MDSDADTIAAVATPPGEGGVAKVRISGPQAGNIARKIWQKPGGQAPSEFETHRAYYGHVLAPDSGEVIDDVILLYFATGKSYTGDEVVEIDCHGGPFISRRVLEAALAWGARPAGPGEFTRRAFLAGKMDLAQAEAVADLIAASGDRELANARMQLEGALSGKVNKAAGNLTEALAEVESRIDFPDEEDISALPVEKLKGLLNSSKGELDELASGYREGRVLKEGYRLILVGRPNVGKSSLLNCLLGADRAIVTQEPGATRDIIEERVVWKGVPFLLVDTAGIRYAPLGSPEQLAAELSRGRAESIASDPAGGVLLTMLDVSENLQDEDLEVLELARKAPHLLIFNKCDLEQKFERADLPEPWRDEKALHISALTGEGIPELVERLIEFRSQTGGLSKSEGYLASSARHYASVKRSLEALERALTTVEEGQPHEIIALELRLARAALNEIIGAAGVEDVLDIIFSRFCVGK